MDNELLTDILEAEREIRQRISAVELRTAERLEALRHELEQMLAQEAAQLAEKLQRAGDAADQAGLLEAGTLTSAARQYADRLENISPVALDKLLLRHIIRILPEGCHDRQDEQT